MRATASHQERCTGMAIILEGGWCQEGSPIIYLVGDTFVLYCFLINIPLWFLSLFCGGFFPSYVIDWFFVTAMIYPTIITKNATLRKHYTEYTEPVASEGGGNCYNKIKDIPSRLPVKWWTGNSPVPEPPPEALVWEMRLKMSTHKPCFPSFPMLPPSFPHGQLDVSASGMATSPL